MSKMLRDSRTIYKIELWTYVLPNVHFDDGNKERGRRIERRSEM
jgi:hypothetical protein